MKNQVILFYKYCQIKDPIKLMDAQKELCKKLNLKGRIIIAKEGMNATLEGSSTNIKKYSSELLKDKRFKDAHFKISEGNGKAFPKLSIKIKPEIIASDFRHDIDPNKVTGKYIYANELHDWINSKKEFYIVDMRNEYEQKVGYFEGSILSNLEQFRDLPKFLPALENLKGKTIVTVCTGGVRCEKASGFLIKNGFKDVYQLYGGIVTYMEKYPNENFKGALYVFDNRLVMGFNMDDPKREIIGRCANCNKPSENFINCTDGFCHRHFIACLDCVDENNQMYCPMGCLTIQRTSRSNSTP